MAEIVVSYLGRRLVSKDLTYIAEYQISKSTLSQRSKIGEDIYIDPEVAVYLSRPCRASTNEFGDELKIWLCSLCPGDTKPLFFPELKVFLS